MDNAMMIEIYGYIGSALVVISMLMSSVIKLRVINMIGSVISGSYALIIGSLPLAIMNICLIMINAYNLYKLLSNTNVYEVVEVGSSELSLEYYIRHNCIDIVKYFPRFDNINPSINRAFMVYLEGEVVGVLIGEDRGNGEFDIHLDYTSPTYRDASVGKVLYGDIGRFNIKKLIFSMDKSEIHANFLKNKFGFIREDENIIKIIN